MRILTKAELTSKSILLSRDHLKKKSTNYRNNTQPSNYVVLTFIFISIKKTHFNE
ncbi:hypothetical protein PROVRUST_06463 [Providencia rustigianii DSM 4541]|uniref:Uncharacterized protein n=1 Tax=Providencia rustigianii DSM 4541 TaxID=500637 RepID=D1P2N6_9GAMM|nr:hypothetical protein PROVRUST_06463 [Providencia rustigianii DSM 4541]